MSTKTPDAVLEMNADTVSTWDPKRDPETVASLEATARSVEERLRSIRDGLTATLDILQAEVARVIERRLIDGLPPVYLKREGAREVFRQRPDGSREMIGVADGKLVAIARFGPASGGSKSE